MFKKMFKGIFELVMSLVLLLVFAIGIVFPPALLLLIPLTKPGKNSDSMDDESWEQGAGCIGVAVVMLSMVWVIVLLVKCI